MTRWALNCGYVPLVDSAPLIIAQALGFAQEEGVALTLRRQPSWAALRDLLALGHLDAAHMLAPMPIAMSLGLSGKPIATDALMMLSTNGTVTGVTPQIADQMRAAGWQGGFLDPKGARAALRSVAQARVEPLRVGVPFPYSMHLLLFAYWMGEARRDFEIVTMPPPLMAQAVAAGEIDLFCVGEPWGSVAVESGAAELILPGAMIWNSAPEKVLAARREWVAQNGAAAGALMRAVFRACAWLDLPENHGLASEILARSEHLDLPDHAIDRALTGQLLPRLGGRMVTVPAFLRFQRMGSNIPLRAQAAWIGAQIAGIQGRDVAMSARAAQDCYRPDLYTAQMGGLAGMAEAESAMILTPDAFFDGKPISTPPKD